MIEVSVVEKTGYSIKYQILKFVNDSYELLHKNKSFLKMLNMMCSISYFSNNYHIKYLTINIIINVLKLYNDEKLSELLYDGFLYGGFKIKYLIASNFIKYKNDNNIKMLEERISLDNSEIIRECIKIKGF